MTLWKYKTKTNKGKPHTSSYLNTYILKRDIRIPTYVLNAFAKLGIHNTDDVKDLFIEYYKIKPTIMIDWWDFQTMIEKKADEFIRISKS